MLQGNILTTQDSSNPIGTCVKKLNEKFHDDRKISSPQNLSSERRYFGI